MDYGIDKDIIKAALREIMTEEPSVFKKWIKEIIREEKEVDAEFEIFLKKNFEKYEETFKALS